MTAAFDYIGKKLLSQKVYNILVDVEVKHRIGMKTRDWKDYSNHPHPYFLSASGLRVLESSVYYPY